MRKFVGYYQLFGAIAGLLVTGWAFFSDPSRLGPVLLTAAVPFTVVGMAGRWMLAGREGALRMTVVAQVLQLPIIMLPTVTWKFIAGAIASYTMSPSSAYLFAGIEATWLFGGRTAEPNPTIGLNVLPIVVITCAFLARRELSSEASAGTAKVMPPTTV